MKLSIVILNYNSKDVLCDCVASLRATIGCVKNLADFYKLSRGGKCHSRNPLSGIRRSIRNPRFPPEHCGNDKSPQESLHNATIRGIDYEIIIVDNGSSDGSRDIIEKLPGVTSIFLDKNVGFSRGNNTGISRAKGDYVLLLNSDTVTLPDSINKMLIYMDNNPETGILGPLLLNKQGKMSQVSWEFAPGIIGEIARKILSPKNIQRNSLIRFTAELLHRATRNVPVVTGASMLVRKEVFSTAGLLDENFFLYFEDTDFCIRTGKAGYKIVFYKDARVIHLIGYSTTKDAVRNYYRQSQLYYYKKHLPVFQQKILNLYLSLKGIKCA